MMKNQEYLTHYFSGVQDTMSVSDYKDLSAELQVFKEKYLDLPPAEFRKRVKEEYSDLLTMSKLKSFQISLESINKKLYFFVIITVVGMVGCLLALITVINGK